MQNGPVGVNEKKKKKKIPKKIKNNLRTTEPRISWKIRTLSLVYYQVENKHLNLDMIKNKLRTFEPHFWRKIKNNRASAKSTGSY